MRFLHTSDWHLGKRIGTHSRLPEQELVMAELCAIADAESVDMVVIAGDVFDNFNPPIEAIELYYRTVRQLTKNNTRPVIVIAGNHDSPDRIESSDPLAMQLGIVQCGFPRTTIATSIANEHFCVSQSTEGAFTLQFSGGEAINIIHTAFCNEQRLKIESDSTIGAELHTLWANVSENLDIDNYTILLSHALMSETLNDKIEEPEGEKPIEHISERFSSAIVPSMVDYVALGHLHRYQEIQGATCPVIYSGSPLAYSFSEASQSKFVSIVDTVAKSHHKQKLNAGKLLKRGSFSSIEAALLWLADNLDCWVELIIKTDEFLNPEQINQLKDCHSGIISIIPEFTANQVSGVDSVIDLTKSTAELFTEYFTSKKQVAPSSEIVALFNEILSEND